MININTTAKYTLENVPELFNCGEPNFSVNTTVC